MGSDPHRANILLPEERLVGVGAACIERRARRRRGLRDTVGVPLPRIRLGAQAHPAAEPRDRSGSQPPGRVQLLTTRLVEPALRCADVSLDIDGARILDGVSWEVQRRRALGRARLERRGQDDAAAHRRALPAPVVGNGRRARPAPRPHRRAHAAGTHRVLVARARGAARTVDDRAPGRDDRPLRRARAVVAPSTPTPIERRATRAAARVALRGARRPQVPDAVGRRAPDECCSRAR